MDIKERITKFQEFIKYWIKETGRILRLTRKPKRSEFDEVTRITGLGILLFGFVGFVIFFITHLIKMS
ncbi:MAG: protein translocase SEC61 complex subunit gamma [Candidatus Altiarchaeum hamiconexum]|uniref:Protein translocase subunit SecE n=1 Tax=Candidatus Altarchaeum hamiconexum TaxID=1803513 RepID=A0A8J7YXJ4_9ARCH|nr:protein translocase SEC61 complex subunit gamma [Candidatus Altarchaeum hamiconexum]OIQ05641.1 MAG: protein translocase SEC61 complex subunit gamma [Candidatus Altarchaeum sp. CG2_30_32_3053]PIN67157.1 MAG: protein translocase SEC61 complex subunit gamma [Candidatus Altarchaeum sp. CG12_big_fil_rev_8_21_14_0_65_33_22]PIV28244.1 MAG: protein translocase SEC61 complex subunit gamma [Candidatus Altarchaeum sp. CG03_land_8_20_14_0_80_32_618]PIZ31162.1 MAG: protein translocase SEC61 complex subun